MNLAYKKILGKFTKVLGFGKTPPPCWEKFPNNIVFFFESVPHFFLFYSFPHVCGKTMRGGVLAEQRRVAKYCGGKICQQAVLSPIRQVYSSVTALNSPLITKSHLFRPFMLIPASQSPFDESGN